MALPQPEVPLTGSCGVVFDNVLYTYSGAAFQSLALEDGAEWKTLPGGESVENGVCVGSTPGDPSVAALYIVGGTSSSPDYTGLQRYTYSSGKWQTIQLTDSVIKDRLGHSATFITASDSILVYSGDQGGSGGPSSQTFTIQASEPHSVQAYQSTISPPGVAPLLFQWSATQAVMISGNPTNVNVMLFDPASSWVDSGTTLAEPLWIDGAAPKAALISGDDGSKSLYTFDLSASPNSVDRILLAGAGGAPVTASAPIENTPSTVKGRQLLADNWPEYNSTLAPTVTRNGFSVASDSTGLMVISGGNDEDPLTVFNGKENQWVDTTELLGAQAALSIESIGSSSTTSSATSSKSSSATSSATSSVTSSGLSSSAPTSASSSIASSTSGATNAAETTSSSSTIAAEPTQGLPPTTILGIVLGLIFGIALILVLLLFCIKKARQKQNSARAGSAEGPNGMLDEKAPVRDLPQGPSPFMRGHAPQDSQGSFSSMAILMGKGQKPGLQRKASNHTNRSSVSSIFNKEFKSTIGRPQYKETPEPDFIPRNEKNLTATANVPRRPPRASVNPDGTMRRSSGWNRYWSGGSLNMLGLGSGNTTQRQTIASETSHYSDTNNRMTQDSATVPPLHVETRFELNRVNSGSPTISQYNPHIREGQSGQIERPVSATSSSGYSSGIPASVHDNWDPTMAKQPWGSQRAPSSAYSQSTVNFVAGLGASNSSQPQTGVSRQPQLKTAAISSDMSWLNLGETKPSQR